MHVWSTALAAAIVGLIVAAFAAPAHGAFPGANGKIAYSHQGDIWTVNPDGTGATQLTSGPASDILPMWSPDGTKIAFDRDFDVYVMDADGMNVHFVADGRSPAWSPDGTRIAFVFGFGLRTSAADGTDIQPVPVYDESGCSVEIGPPLTWSPDGTRMTSSGVFGGFECMHQDSGSCYFPAAGGTATCVANGHDETYEDWSPNSRWILVGTCCSSPGMYYFGQGDFVELTPGEAFDGLDGNAAWSPDGTTIVFRRDPHFGGPEPPEVYLVDAADGGNLRPLGGPHVGSNPDWQPLPVNAYPRPKGASPTDVPLVPAYEPCASPNRTHGPPLAFPACGPPTQKPGQLTVGTPDANGQPAKLRANVRINPLRGLPSTPADEADVRLRATINDVRLRSDLSDYAGNLEVRLTLQITDKDNTPHPGGPGPATVQELTHSHPLPCSTTPADTTVGSTCQFDTTVEAVVPGAVKELRRAIWELKRIAVHDGAGNLFLTQGIFVP